MMEMREVTVGGDGCEGAASGGVAINLFPVSCFIFSSISISISLLSCLSSPLSTCLFGPK